MAARAPTWFCYAFACALAFAVGCSTPAADGSGHGADAGATDGAGLDGGVKPSKPLALLFITPARGPVAGGNQLDLEGSGFGPDAQVTIGGAPAEVAFRGGTTHLFVVVPAAAQAGVVGVQVRNAPKATPATIVKGYTYLGSVSADAFSPDHGPALGGTLITVHGSGFASGDRVLVGWAEAMASEVVDPNTLVAVVPARNLPNGIDLLPVTVAVRHPSGVAQVTGTFTYGRAPHLLWVEPPVVPLQGATVVVHGEGMGNVDTLYARGAKALLAAGTASSVRGASLPALTALDPQAKPGPADLLATGQYGTHKLNPAFVYSGPVTIPQMFGVTPASGVTSGGTVVALLLALPEGTAIQSVSFGGKAAQCTTQGGAKPGGPTQGGLGSAVSVVCTTPSHLAGAVAVQVQTDHGSAQKDAAFTFVGPLEVQKTSPDSGPTAGGTQIDVRGTGFSKDCTVRIGLFLAQVVSASADGKALTVVTPPGASGSADVSVTCSGVEALLAGGFAYTDGKIHINAVVPATGATGGGTPVKIFGSGFKKGMQVLFAGKPATAIVVTSSSSAEIKTPPHEAGPVSVDVLLGKDTESLLDGFAYVNPTSSHGGTAGEQADGTLNVTVLNIYTLEPIEEAYVQVGQPGTPEFPKYNGTTDDKGQVVFAGSDLTAPLTVSATKTQFTASSIVSFDARNATLLLFPFVPPSSGKGDPPPSLPFATLRGKVLDLDKYLQVPPNNCLKSGIAGPGDKTCDPCLNDSQCAGTAQNGATYRCIDNGVAGKRCLADCSKQDVCTSGFGCYAEATVPGLKVCKPQLGIRKVFCSTTVRSWEEDEDNPTPGLPADTFAGDGALPWQSVSVDEATGEFEISSRLDELAIQCFGGYVQNDPPKAFVPTTLGVHRHVFPQPGTFTDGEENGEKVPGKIWLQNHLDVRLDIPLRRALPVRLDHPQAAFSGTFGTFRLTPWIDLGSDGLVQLPRLERDPPKAGGSGVADNVALPYQPLGLPEDMSATSYIYYARAEFPVGEKNSPPITATLHPDIMAPGDANLRVRAQDGLGTETAIGVDQELTAVLAGDDGKILILARNGRIYRGPVEGPSLIFVPQVIDPYAQPVAMLAAAGTPTDATVVGANGLIRRVLAGKVTVEQGALTTTLRGICAGPLGRVAVGDSGGVQVDVGAGWQVVQVATALPLNSVVCTATGALAVGSQGTLITLDLTTPIPKATVDTLVDVTLRAIARDPNGTLWVAGDKPAGEGPLLLRRDPGGTWQPGWPAGTVTPPIPPLLALVALPDAMLVIDQEGGQWRLDAAGVHNEAPERRDLRPNAGITVADGRTVLVGQPGLWLGPFLTIPEIAKPDSLTKGGPVPVEWSVAPGPLGSFTRVHLDGSGFPFWWLYVGPGITSLTLPDFSSLAGIKVFINNPQIQYVVKVDRGYVPNFSINGFGTFDLEFSTWRSWAKNARGLAK